MIFFDQLKVFGKILKILCGVYDTDSLALCALWLRIVKTLDKLVVAHELESANETIL